MIGNKTPDPIRASETLMTLVFFANVILFVVGFFLDFSLGAMVILLMNALSLLLWQKLRTNPEKIIAMSKLKNRKKEDGEVSK